MKILLQWSQSNPRDWQEIDSRNWPHLPKKPLPRGGEVIDDAPGWVHYVNVQGVIFTADHYACVDLPDGGLRVYSWNDDEEDYPDGEKFAQVYTFLPLAPDPKMGGAWNTRQSQVIYVQPSIRAKYEASGSLQDTEFRSWEEFVPPDPVFIRHGVWTPNALNEGHVRALKTRGWREWTEGVPAEQIQGGRVRNQRPQGLYDKPLGTKTVYQRDTDLANGVHAALVAANEDALNATAGTGQTEASGTLAGGASGILFIFTSAADFPADAAWPTGTYRAQFDVSAVGANMSYGLATAGAASGHFARVNSGLTSDLEVKTQTEGLFNGTTGLKLATTGSVSWSAGATSNRWELVMAGTRPASHGNQSVTLTFDSDAYTDGPWPVAEIYSETPEITLSFSPDLIERKVTSDSPSTTSRLLVPPSYARRFAGSLTTDHITVDHHADLEAQRPMTVMGWVKLLVTESASANIFVKRGDTDKGWVLTYHRVLHGVFFDFYGVGSAGAGVVDDDEWHHIAATVNAGGSVVFYYDGNEAGTDSLGAPLSTTQPLHLSVTVDTAGTITGYSTSTLADCRIYNTVLTQDQVREAMRGGNPLIGNLKLQLRLLGDSPEPDSSGNGHSGTVSGTTVAAGPPGLTYKSLDALVFSESLPGVVAFSSTESDGRVLTDSTMVTSQVSPSVVVEALLLAEQTQTIVTLDATQSDQIIVAPQIYNETPEIALPLVVSVAENQTFVEEPVAVEVSDAFARGDSDTLGASWIEYERTTSVLRIVSGQIQMHAGISGSGYWHGWAVWDGQVGNNHYSELTYRSPGSANESGVGVRLSGTSYSSLSGYFLFYRANAAQLRIVKVVNNGLPPYSGSQLGDVYSVALVNGDKIRLEIAGTALRARLNGASIIEVTDAAIVSGKPGIAQAGDTYNFNYTWDDWKGGLYGGGAAFNVEPTESDQHVRVISESLEASVALSPSLDDRLILPEVIDAVGTNLQDNFNRANSNTLDKLWVESESSADTIRIANNQLYIRESNVGGYCAGFARYNVATNANQFSRMLWYYGEGAWRGHSGVAVRIDPTCTWDAFKGYALLYFWVSSPYTLKLHRYDGTSLNGSDGTVLATVQVSLSQNDVISLEVEGNRLRARRNGTVVIDVIDSTYSSGQVGVVGRGNNATANWGLIWDDWRGGDFSPALIPTTTDIFTSVQVPEISLALPPSLIDSAIFMNTPLEIGALLPTAADSFSKTYNEVPEATFALPSSLEDTTTLVEAQDSVLVFTSTTIGVRISGEMPEVAVAVTPFRTFLDNFNRTDVNGSLGTPWSENEDEAYAIYIGSSTYLVLQSNSWGVVQGGRSHAGRAFYDAPGIGNSHRIQLRFGTVGESFSGRIPRSGLCVRGSGIYTNFTGYLALYRPDPADDSGIPRITLNKYENQTLKAAPPGGTEIGVYEVVLAADDIMELSVVSSTVRVRVNGEVKIEVTDATITSGKPGVVTIGEAVDAGDNAWMSWEDAFVSGEMAEDYALLADTGNLALVFDPTQIDEVTAEAYTETPGVTLPLVASASDLSVYVNLPTDTFALVPTTSDQIVSPNAYNETPQAVARIYAVYRIDKGSGSTPFQ